MQEELRKTEGTHKETSLLPFWKGLCVTADTFLVISINQPKDRYSGENNLH